MKLHQVKSNAKFAGLTCSICVRGAKSGQQILVTKVINKGTAMTHLDCAAPLLENSFKELDIKINQIRDKFTKEKV